MKTSVRTLEVKSVNNIITNVNNRENIPNNRIYILLVIKGKMEL
jgi:hypothetical protein